MSLIVHGRASSSNVQAVMWGLAEIGLAAERRDVGGRFGGADTAEFRALNPFGRVPVLQYGDTALFESPAILRNLLLTHDLEGRLATSPHGHCWAEWGKTSLCAAFLVPIFWRFYRTPEAERDMSAVIEALRRFEGLAGIAMEQRGTGPFIMGEHLSLPDIWIGHLLFRYFTLDLPRHPPNGLEVYYTTLTEGPAYQTHVIVDYPELAGRLAF